MGALWRPYRFSLVSRRSLVLRRSLVSRSDDKIFSVVLGRRQKHHLVGERIADASFEHKPTEAPEHGGHIHALSAFGHIAQTVQGVGVVMGMEPVEEHPHQLSERGWFALFGSDDLRLLHIMHDLNEVGLGANPLSMILLLQFEPLRCNLHHSPLAFLHLFAREREFAVSGN